MPVRPNRRAFWPGGWGNQNRPLLSLWDFLNSAPLLLRLVGINGILSENPSSNKLCKIQRGGTKQRDESRVEKE